MLINRIFYCKHMIKTKHVTHHNIRSHGALVSFFIIIFFYFLWKVRGTMFVVIFFYIFQPSLFF
jgi:hypothetical protein